MKEIIDAAFWPWLSSGFLIVFGYSVGHGRGSLASDLAWVMGMAGVMLALELYRQHKLRELQRERLVALGQAREVIEDLRRELLRGVRGSTDAEVLH